MNERSKRDVFHTWADLGVAFAIPLPPRTGDQTADIEQAVIDAARSLHAHPRLLETVVSWLVDRGDLVDARRLSRLAASELVDRERTALGFLIDSALELGAPESLREALGVCAPSPVPEPLFDVYREKPSLWFIAESQSGPLALKWRLWSEPARFRSVVVRPLPWLLARHPSLRDRLIRKGDLRVSILETLRHDTGGSVKSESELARLVGATRAAVRRAVRALEREGEVVIAPKAKNRRDTEIRLRDAA